MFWNVCPLCVQLNQHDMNICRYLSPLVQAFHLEFAFHERAYLVISGQDISGAPCTGSSLRVSCSNGIITERNWEVHSGAALSGSGEHCRAMAAMIDDGKLGEKQ
jgi:hypothetical protein